MAALWLNMRNRRRRRVHKSEEVGLEGEEGPTMSPNLVHFLKDGQHAMTSDVLLF